MELPAGDEEGDDFRGDDAPGCRTLPLRSELHRPFLDLAGNAAVFPVPLMRERDLQASVQTRPRSRSVN